MMIARNISVNKKKEKKSCVLQDAPDKEVIEWNPDNVLTEFNNLNKTTNEFYFKELVKAVVKHGSQRAAARAIGLPKTVIHKDMALIKKHFKNKLCS